ncbi:unnamed protein product [Rotaria socialis]
MNNSIVRIVDLPDEILVTIFKKLHHFDVLYSLVGVNKKLDNVACDVTFTRSIDLATISLDKADDSRINAILDRFCIEILPRIQKRMECLTIQACFLQRVYHASDYVNLRSITISTLLKLKCFSLYAYLPTNEFDNEVVPFLRRMSHLEKLTLSLGIRGRTSFIDGTHLDNCILSRLPHLHTFVFNIITDFVRSTEYFEPSADHIRRTFIQRGHHADCYIDCHHSNMRRCHVYSVPLNMECMRHISHGFPGGTFINVRILSMLDDSHPFEHNFFAQISRSFPLLSRLIVRNTTPQKEKRSHQLLKLEEISSVIEYSHLVELNCIHAHIDYVEQFLSNVNTCLPCLCKLHVQYEHLVTVTENFTRNTTRMNCVKVKHITFYHEVAMARSKDFHLYFPLL